jgi:hypothetical protein
LGILLYDGDETAYSIETGHPFHFKLDSSPRQTGHF